MNGVKGVLYFPPRVCNLVEKLKRKYRVRFKEGRTKSKFQRAAYKTRLWNLGEQEPHVIVLIIYNTFAYNLQTPINVCCWWYWKLIGLKVRWNWWTEQNSLGILEDKLFYLNMSLLASLGMDKKITVEPNSQLRREHSPTWSSPFMWTSPFHLKDLGHIPSHGNAVVYIITVRDAF